MKIGYLYLILTIMFSCIANAFAKMSKSFSNHKYGGLSIFFMILVMFFLAKAYDDMSMGLVYSLYSASLVLFTIILGYCMYHERPDTYTLCGVGFVLIGMFFINVLGTYKCK